MAPLQRVHREQEVARTPGFDPRASTLHRPTRHQRIPMQVTPQFLRPRVQQQREGTDAAEPARVGGEPGQRGRRALHQRVADPAWVHAGQRIHLVRQREHQVAVRHVEQLGQPRGAPGIAVDALAGRHQLGGPLAQADGFTQRVTNIAFARLRQGFVQLARGGISTKDMSGS